ncbi:MAG: aldolase/citrate lyase family protein [Bacteroidales bacterium]
MKQGRELYLGTWITMGAPVATELISQMGFDWLLLDMEHGFITESELLSNIMAVKKEVKIIVRLGLSDPKFIGRILDWGVDGVMMPQVSHPLQLHPIIEAINYPPKGERGYSSSARLFNYGLDKTSSLEKIEPPLLIAQIESEEGVLNSREIASLEGVDMLFVGPRDLTLDLSLENRSLSYDRALSLTIDAAAKEGKKCGILLSPNEEPSIIESKGFNFFAIGSDLTLMREGYKNIVNKILK